MVIFSENSYGQLQKTKFGFRIVRSGDGCVAFNFTKLSEAHELFTKLGKKCRTLNTLSILK